jgi:hypothetical protein
MRYGTWILATVVTLTLGSLALAADPPRRGDDPTLNREQNKYFKQLKATLAAPPINPNDQPRYLQTVQTELRRLLSTNTQPSRQSTDALAGTLVNGIGSGLISVQQAAVLSKTMAKALDANRITYQDTNQLVRSLEPLVTQTGLGSIEKLRLYSEILQVVRTAPTYAPPGR